jgi:hypothetical protein
VKKAVCVVCFLFFLNHFVLVLRRSKSWGDEGQSEMLAIDFSRFTSSATAPDHFSPDTLCRPPTQQQCKGREADIQNGTFQKGRQARKRQTKDRSINSTYTENLYIHKKW